MLTRIRLQAKLAYHKYNSWLVSCLSLVSRHFLSNTFCLGSSMQLGSGSYMVTMAKLTYQGKHAVYSIANVMKIPFAVAYLLCAELRNGFLRMQQLCVCSYLCIAALRQFVWTAIWAVWPISAFPLVDFAVYACHICYWWPLTLFEITALVGALAWASSTCLKPHMKSAPFLTESKPKSKPWFWIGRGLREFKQQTQMTELSSAFP